MKTRFKSTFFELLASLVLSIIFCSLAYTSFGQTTETIYLEKKGVVAVEAENFFEQKEDKRTWFVKDETNYPSEGDGDSLEYKKASVGKYVELLPDTRVTHDDKLIPGINFSNEPGLNVLSYKVYINTPGKYYVWVRAFSTGAEDNGIHVGLDGEWPESGQRMQWCKGKKEWTWASQQRTKEVHCGVPELIFLEIKEAGVHTIQFSMREDGFAFDKFILSQEYKQPKGKGAKPKIHKQ